MKTKTIPCPCCAIPLKSPLQGGPKVIICPVCKMRVEDPDGFEAPSNQEVGMSQEVRRKPAPASTGKHPAKPVRTRSSPVKKGFYVCWILLCLIGNGLTVFLCSFIAMFHNLRVYHPVSLAAILLLVSFPCYLGIFLRKEWGVYGFCSSNLLAALLLFTSGNGEIALYGFILVVGVVVFLTLRSGIDPGGHTPY